MTTSSNVSASKRSKSVVVGGCHLADLLVGRGGRGWSTSSSCSAAWTRAASDSRVSSGWIGTVTVAEHRAVVDAFVGDEVDHHAGGGALAGEGLVPGPFDGVGAGQLAGQRRVQVDDPVGEPAEEAHREDAHPAGEHDEVGRRTRRRRRRGGRRSRPAVSPGWRPTWTAGTPARTGPHEGVGLGLVGDDGDDGGRQPAARARIDDRLQVAAVARGQHHETRALHGSTLDGCPDGPTDP